MSTGAERRYSVEDYLALERQSEARHEFFDGEMFAMAGGTVRHSVISANVIRELGNATARRPCQVFSGDMKVMCPTGLWTYPDVSVVCGEPQVQDDHQDVLLNPLVIIEVLSPSTEAYDRGRKFANYKSIESLEAYVLVAQDRPQVEYFSRAPTGDWPVTTASGIEATLEIPALECSLPLAEVYRNVKLC